MTILTVPWYRTYSNGPKKTMKVNVFDFLAIRTILDEFQ